MQMPFISGDYVDYLRTSTLSVIRSTPFPPSQHETTQHDRVCGCPSRQTPPAFESSLVDIVDYSSTSHHTYALEDLGSDEMLTARLA